MSQLDDTVPEQTDTAIPDYISNADSETPTTLESVEVNDSDDDLESEYQFFRSLVKNNIFQLDNVNEQEIFSTWLFKTDEEKDKSLRCAYIKLMLVSLQHIDDSFGLFKSSAPASLPHIENTPNALREIIEKELSKDYGLEDNTNKCVGYVSAAVSADLTSFASSFADDRCVQVFYARSDHAINTWFLPSHLQLPVSSRSASQWERALSTSPKPAAQNSAVDPIIRDNNNIQRSSIKQENSDYEMNEMQGICKRLMVDQIPIDNSGQELFRWYEHSRLDGTFRPTNEICVDKDTCRHVKNQLELDERAINVTNRMYPGRIRIVLDPRLIFEVIGLHLDLAGKNHYNFHSHKNTLNIKTIDCKIAAAHTEPDNSKKNTDQKLSKDDHRSLAKTPNTEPVEDCSCVDKNTSTKAKGPCRQPVIDKKNGPCCNNNAANTCDVQRLGNAAKSSQQCECSSSQSTGQTDWRGQTADDGQKYNNRSLDSFSAPSSCCCILDKQCDNTTSTKALTNKVPAMTAESGKSQPSQCCNTRFKAGSDKLVKNPMLVGQENYETTVGTVGSDEWLTGLKRISRDSRIAGGGVPRRSCSVTAPSRIPIACSRRQPRRIDQPVQLYPRSRLPVPVRLGPAPPRIPQPVYRNHRSGCVSACGNQRTATNDPCTSERNPCTSDCDPCTSERDPCTPQHDPCVQQRDPCAPPRDQCTPQRDPSAPPRDQCTPQCDPPRDKCTPQRDPCAPPQDQCTPESDPCPPPRDLCTPQRDTCAPQSDPCTPQNDPCTPQRDLCAPQHDPCSSQRNQYNSSSYDVPQPRHVAENNGMEFTISGTFRLGTTTQACPRQNNTCNQIDQFLANMEGADMVAPRSLAVPGCPYVHIDEAASVPTPQRWRQMMDERSSIGSQPLSMDLSSLYRNSGQYSGSSGNSCCCTDTTDDSRPPFGLDDSFTFNTSAASRHRSNGCMSVDRGCKGPCHQHRRDSFDRNTC